MSATAVKATRRDIRRAFGPDAVQMLEAHESGLRGHAQGLQRCANAIGACEKELQRLAAESKAAGDVGGRMADVVFRQSFWGRLRWLLAGR